MPEQNDITIINAARHDPQAFGQLYQRYLDRIYRYAYRRTGRAALAEDITAATFETALRKLSGYQPSGGGFAAWLYTIARHQIIAHYRKEKLLAPLKGLTSNLPDPEEKLLAASDRQDLHQAVQHLSQADQDILTLRFFEDFSSAEVADILGISRQNVYLRLHRALKRLESELTRQTATEGAQEHATE